MRKARKEFLRRVIYCFASQKGNFNLELYHTLQRIVHLSTMAFSFTCSAVWVSLAQCLLILAMVCTPIERKMISLRQTFSDGYCEKVLLRFLVLLIGTKNKIIKKKI